MQTSEYAELHAHSANTFLEGTDTPAALVTQAQKLGLSGLAVLDVDGMYSAVQTARAGEQVGLPIIYGTELTLDHRVLPEDLPQQATANHNDLGVRLPVLASSQTGYHNLCQILSTHFLAEEGRREATLTLEEIHAFNDDIFILTGTAHGPLRRALTAGGMPSAARVLDQLIDTVGSEHIGVEASLQPHNPPSLADALATLADARNLPLVATGAVRCATPEQQKLADVFSATRLNLSLDQAEPYLPSCVADFPTFK